MSAAAEEILTILLPSADASLLLEACLGRGDRAHDAWKRWLSARSPVDEEVCADLARTRTLVPLLGRSLQDNGLQVGAGVQAYVHAATLRETLRADRFRRIAAEAADLLADAGAAPVVVRGTALAATAYESWSLRHCHDLDLLVRPADLEGACHVLMEAGWAPLGRLEVMRAEALLVHGTGMHLALHSRPFALAQYDADVDWFDPALHAEIAIEGTPARCTVPEATLVHVLGHATYSPSQRTANWVADAAQLLRPGARIDSALVVELVERHALGLPVLKLVRYLDELGVAVPGAMLEGLVVAARTARRSGEDAAIKGAVQVASGGRSVVRFLRQIPTWRARIRFLRWALAPSYAYIRNSAAAGATRPSLPAAYALRLARGIASAAASAALPSASRSPPPH